MNYTLDCEFNGYGGELLSLALYREDGNSLYISISMEEIPCVVRLDNGEVSRYNGVFATNPKWDPWVQIHVVPHLSVIPEECKNHALTTRRHAQEMLQLFLQGDAFPVIHVDWPDDIKYLCELLLTGPGTMVDIPTVAFRLHRVDAYPNARFPQAIRHHAWWDARVLWDCIADSIQR